MVVLLMSYDNDEVIGISKVGRVGVQKPNINF